MLCYHCVYKQYQEKAGPTHMIKSGLSTISSILEYIIKQPAPIRLHMHSDYAVIFHTCLDNMWLNYCHKQKFYHNPR